jgi:hypothetical protein
MKLKETASTEYRRIKNHWEVIQEFIMESNSSNSFSFSYKGRQGVLRSSNWESITTMQGRNKFCAEEWNGMKFSGVAADGWLLHNLLLI